LGSASSHFLEHSAAAGLFFEHASVHEDRKLFLNSRQNPSLNDDPFPQPQRAAASPRHIQARYARKLVLRSNVMVLSF